MKDYKKFKKQLFENKNIKKAYDNLGSEFALIRMIIEKRLKKGFTQTQLAQKIGTKQPVISRFECGTYNPSVKFLFRLADALGADLRISIS